ncbi:MAG: hypothetical protein QF907_08825 [Nitrospinota bacterium]|jgi:hypothetical protein|nr:hypothetical protein [Nitrospinota bacterium]MDP7580499.1 hypothetical protein [Nitrospinota bacterium]HJN01496.1 hypothetical protein [Nitrospinota bacterium]|tara:strand:- start:221 stop:604 length:384 start_codon:yes stop_codon:yes gene_type:complete
MNDIDYQLYKNSENFGIVVFPKNIISSDLDSYAKGMNFEPVESGKAVKRRGIKGKDETYMMPQEVQEKYDIKKFIILQLLPKDDEMKIAIYDPEWGLTLVETKYLLKEIVDNIPKTLDVFRGVDQKN